MSTQNQCRNFATGLFLLTVTCTILTGCAGQKTVGDAKKKSPPAEGEVAKPAIPIMLHNKQIQSGNQALTLNGKRISRVEFESVSPPAADGSYTATVNFRQKRKGGFYYIKVNVTYKIEKTTSSSGIVVENYPVLRLKTLAIETAKKTTANPAP